MNRRSKSTLFLMEQLVVIVVFAVCAAACVKILTHSYLVSKEAKDLSNALLAAENGAECYKASGGDISLTAYLLGGTEADIDGKSTALVYYNSANRVCAQADSVYVLRITADSSDADASSTNSLNNGSSDANTLDGGSSGSDYPPNTSAILEVEKVSGGELLSFTIIARRGANE